MSLHIFDAELQFIGNGRIKQGREIAKTAVKELSQLLIRPGITARLLLLLLCRDLIHRDDEKNRKIGEDTNEGIVFLPFLTAHFHQGPSQVCGFCS